ncbi:carbon monoxide dehydrogenase subunit G (plasmid) [Leisingera sp. M527]|uniref:CoxG family protein n=1 Tax=Leisingera sp. M527 TaxID=2867014 RepID=UPI0021A7C1CC|nr:carbon monoxide dehydrogenase subunit G [Leisingera sp. M527]UWQ35438.1 carbon monoxide dehydrogenase subunit G [Leisingera sp. M527]
MKSSDSRLLALPRETVFDAFLNTDILQRSIPGCESIVKNEDGSLSAVIAAKVGPVRAKFAADIDIVEAIRPEIYRASGSGKGVAGMATGDASATLTEEDGKTRVDYQFEAKIGGKIAQLGSRVIDSFVKKFANDFFEEFELALTEGPSSASEPSASDVAPSGPQNKSGSNKLALTLLVLAAVAGVCYAIFAF